MLVTKASEEGGPYSTSRWRPKPVVAGAATKHGQRQLRYIDGWKLRDGKRLQGKSRERCAMTWMGYPISLGEATTSLVCDYATYSHPIASSNKG